MLWAFLCRHAYAAVAMAQRLRWHGRRRHGSIIFRCQYRPGPDKCRVCRCIQTLSPARRIAPYGDRNGIRLLEAGTACPWTLQS